MPPPIPPITDSELLKAVSALTSSAEAYRIAFWTLSNRLLSKNHNDEDFHYVMKLGEGDILHLSDKVIDSWRQQLGLDDEDDEAET